MGGLVTYSWGGRLGTRGRRESAPAALLPNVPNVFRGAPINDVHKIVGFNDPECMMQDEARHAAVWEIIEWRVAVAAVPVLTCPTYPLKRLLSEMILIYGS